MHHRRFFFRSFNGKFVVWFGLFFLLYTWVRLPLKIGLCRSPSTKKAGITCETHPCPSPLTGRKDLSALARPFARVPLLL
jgi:hypothetical protein